MNPKLDDLKFRRNIMLFCLFSFTIVLTYSDKNFSNLMVFGMLSVYAGYNLFELGKLAAQYEPSDLEESLPNSDNFDNSELAADADTNATSTSSKLVESNLQDHSTSVIDAIIKPTSVNLSSTNSFTNRHDKDRFDPHGVKRLYFNIAPTQKNWALERGCKYKRSFDTMAHAQTAIRNMKTNRNPGRPMHSYYCDVCHKIHNGHVPQKKRK